MRYPQYDPPDGALREARRKRDRGETKQEDKGKLEALERVLILFGSIYL
jgi:hypothetical protein